MQPMFLFVTLLFQLNINMMWQLLQRLTLIILFHCSLSPAGGHSGPDAHLALPPFPFPWPPCYPFRSPAIQHLRVHRRSHPPPPLTPSRQLQSRSSLTKAPEGAPREHTRRIRHLAPSGTIPRLPPPPTWTLCIRVPRPVLLLTRFIGRRSCAQSSC